MNLEELRSAQNAERQRSDLQPLRESFYEEAGEYVAELKAERDRVAARAEDPWSSPEVARLTDEIETAEEVLEAVYERRMGKILKRASLAAADTGVDEEGLTAEERALFTDLVDRIEANKATVLDRIAGEDESDAATESGSATPADADPGRTDADAPDDSPADGPASADRAGTPRETVDSAADAMGPPEAGETGRSDRGGSTGPDGRSEAGGRTPVDPADGPPGGDRGGRSDPENRGGHSPGETATTADGPAGGSERQHGGGAVEGRLDRVTVRVTRDVDAFLGVDDREYDLAAEDVVELPTQNATPLVERDAAERLD
jgi:DNA replication factor GINS